MSYRQLKCTDCEQVLRSIVATEAGELLSPPEETCPACGQTIGGGQAGLDAAVRQFHEAHRAHHLIEVEIE